MPGRLAMITFLFQSGRRRVNTVAPQVGRGKLDRKGVVVSYLASAFFIYYFSLASSNHRFPEIGICVEKMHPNHALPRQLTRHRTCDRT